MSWLNLQDFLKQNQGEGVRMQGKVEDDLRSAKNKAEAAVQGAGNAADTNATKLGRDAFGNYTLGTTANPAAVAQQQKAAQDLTAYYGQLDPHISQMVQEALADPSKAKAYDDAIKANAGKYGADKVPLDQKDGSPSVMSWQYKQALDKAKQLQSDASGKVGQVGLTTSYTPGTQTSAKDALGNDTAMNDAIAQANAFGTRLNDFKTTEGTSNEINKVYGGGGMLDALLYREDPSQKWADKLTPEGTRSQDISKYLPANYNSLSPSEKAMAQKAATERTQQDNLQNYTGGIQQQRGMGMAMGENQPSRFGNLMQQFTNPNTVGGAVGNMQQPSNNVGFASNSPTGTGKQNTFDYNANDWSTKYNDMLKNIQDKWNTNYNQGQSDAAAEYKQASDRNNQQASATPGNTSFNAPGAPMLGWKTAPTNNASSMQTNYGSGGDASSGTQANATNAASAVDEQNKKTGSRTSYYNGGIS